MATEKRKRKTEKRREYRGYGQLDLVGLGEQEDYINRLILVEREPDNLMAAALLVSNLQGEFKVVFTDRHSINYDVTGKLKEVD